MVTYLEVTMLSHLSRKSHRMLARESDDPDPGPLPVEPVEGLMPPDIPDDPEHDRVVEPED